jgi:broad specificity phosphatase PhoE
MKKILLILTCLIANIVLAQESTTTIYLLRHAEKAADGTADPGISDAGRERTKAWGEYFKDKKIKSYYSTKYKRAVETASWTGTYTLPNPGVPGTTTSLNLRNYDPMTFSLNDVAQKHKAESIVIVGHSNTIPTLVNNFIGDRKYPDMQENEFGNLYIIKITGDKITHELIKM